MIDALVRLAESKDLRVEISTNDFGFKDLLIGQDRGLLMEDRGTGMRVVPFLCPPNTLGVFRFGNAEYLTYVQSVRRLASL